MVAFFKGILSRAHPYTPFFTQIPPNSSLTFAHAHIKGEILNSWGPVCLLYTICTPRLCKRRQHNPLILKEVIGGGGGNRTRVRRYYTYASTCVGCLLDLGIRDAGNQASGIPISPCLAAGSGEVPGSQPADCRYPRNADNPGAASCF
jgi:hypothetical protein